MTVADNLRAAAELISQGWIQGIGCDHIFDGGTGKRVCATIALARVLDCVRVTPEHITLHNYIGMSVVAWNDMKGQTQAGVITGLRDAATMWEIENGIYPVEMLVGGEEHDVQNLSQVVQSTT